jgi:hypothetical protein
MCLCGGEGLCLDLGSEAWAVWAEWWAGEANWMSLTPIELGLEKRLLEKAETAWKKSASIITVL